MKRNRWLRIIRVVWIEINKSRWLMITFLVTVSFLAYFIWGLFHRPEKSIIVRFRQTPPIGRVLLRDGIGIFYRGFGVGKIAKVSLSDDQQYIVFYGDIYYKNLKVPKNVQAILRTQGVLGDKYISLELPKNPSPKLLPDGSVLEGVTVIEDLGQMVLNEVGRENIKKIVTGTVNFVDTLNTVLKENKGDVSQFIRTFSKAGININQILDDISGITDDPEVKSGIKSTIIYSSRSAQKLNELVSRQEIDDIITGAPLTLSEARGSVKTVNESIIRATENIPDTTNKIKETAQSITDTVKTYNCVGQGISDMLSKRFLVFKLLFGQPGKCLERCNNCPNKCPITR